MLPMILVKVTNSGTNLAIDSATESIGVVSPLIAADRPEVLPKAPSKISPMRLPASLNSLAACVISAAIPWNPVSNPEIKPPKKPPTPCVIGDRAAASEAKVGATSLINCEALVIVSAKVFTP